MSAKTLLAEGALRPKAGPPSIGGPAGREPGFRKIEKDARETE